MRNNEGTQRAGGRREAKLASLPGTELGRGRGGRRGPRRCSGLGLNRAQQAGKRVFKQDNDGVGAFPSRACFTHVCKL